MNNLTTQLSENLPDLPLYILAEATSACDYCLDQVDYYYHWTKWSSLSLDRVIIIALLLDGVIIVWIKWIIIIIKLGDYHYHWIRWLSLDRMIIIVIGLCDYHYHWIGWLSLDRMIIIVIGSCDYNYHWIGWLSSGSGGGGSGQGCAWSHAGDRHHQHHRYRHNHCHDSHHHQYQHYHPHRRRVTLSSPSSSNDDAIRVNYTLFVDKFWKHLKSRLDTIRGIIIIMQSECSICFVAFLSNLPAKWPCWPILCAGMSLFVYFLFVFLFAVACIRTLVYLYVFLLCLVVCLSFCELDMISPFINVQKHKLLNGLKSLFRNWWP